jgi:ribonuclease HII
MRHILTIIQDVNKMGKRKTIDLSNVSDSKRIKLIWEIRRQMQQEIFEEKLTRCLLNSNARVNYPDGISMAINDLMLKAAEELKQKPCTEG